MLGIIGFFVIPVVGLVIGFVLGVYLAEWPTVTTSGSRGRRRSMRSKGVALSVGVELPAHCWPPCVGIRGLFDRVATSWL